MLQNTIVLGYADDLIAITPDLWELEKFYQMAKSFCSERLLTINQEKSDVVVSGALRQTKTLFGFPVPRSAKYLGVT